MLKKLIVAAVAATALTVAAAPAQAGLANNGYTNGWANGLSTNGTVPNAVIAHAPPSDFCAQGSGDAVIAHAPPSDLCAQSTVQPAGLSLGGVDGMKVMSVELPR